jgi:hypothetical protein
MTNIHLFAEVFPVDEGAIPGLAAYGLVWDGDLTKLGALAEKLVPRLQKAFGGHWLWMVDRIVTDNPRSEVEIMITLDIIKGEEPKFYAQLQAIGEDPHWQATPQAQATFVALTGLREVELEMHAVLSQNQLKAKAQGTGRVGGYDLRVNAWDVQSNPSMSLTVFADSQPIPAAQQSQLVKLVSDVAKNAGILTNAYNSRDVPDAFLQPDFEANLMFDKKRVRPYKLELLGQDFNNNGVYKRRKEFESGPIRIAVINTLPDKIDDFIEAMKRQLEKKFGYTIEMIRERKVKVVSRKNVESAVKVIEGEDAHIVLVFVPTKRGDDGVDAEYLKTLTVGKGIASQIIDEATANDPEAMPMVIMGLLGKTGNVPFVLAEPLVYAQMIVGLDIVPEKRKDGQFVTGIARVYRSDGAFLRYGIREIALENDKMWFVLMRDLFPQKEFKDKRVILHYNGLMGDAVREALDAWGKAIGAAFYIVEIVAEGAPHLYALQGGKVTPPPWGSAFKVNDYEAFLVTATKGELMTAPLYVRATPPLTIEQALHSVLVWTLLHYGSPTPPRLPVTVQYSDVIGGWLAKGTLPEAKDGAVPFWL